MKTCLTVTVGLIAMLVGGLFYLGVFSPIEFEEKEMGPYHVVGKMYKGPFSGLGPTYTEVDAEMTALIAKPKSMIGVFYDDPHETPEEQLRTFVSGVIVPDDVSKFEGHPELTIKKYGRTKCLVAKFPLKTLVLSPMIGAMMVYPKMEGAMKESGRDFKDAKSVFEVCDEEFIYYAVPIDNQEEWNEVPLEPVVDKDKDMKE